MPLWDSTAHAQIPASEACFWQQIKPAQRVSNADIRFKKCLETKLSNLPKV